jgi:hypothetical protein
MNRDEANSWIILEVFGDSDPVRALNSGEGMASDDENVVHPVTKAFRAAEVNHLMGKAASIDGWDEEIGTVTPRTLTPTKNIAKSSAERFAKVSAKIRELYGPEHTEEAEEAIALAEKMRAEAVAEIIATH